MRQNIENGLPGQDVVWSDVFITGVISYKKSQAGRRQAIADALNTWANCMAGYKRPPKFGEGMVAIGNFLHINPSPENLMKVELG